MSRAQSKDQVYDMYAYQHPPTRIDCFGNSVTRFGKISLLGQIKKPVWLFLRVHLVCLAKFLSTLAIYNT